MFFKRLTYPKWSVKFDLKMGRSLKRPTFRDCYGPLIAVVNPRLHRPEYYAYICGTSFHVASFYNKESYERFLKKTGLHLTLDAYLTHDGTTVYQVRERVQECYFWNRLQVPLFVHRTTLLSNGSYVTGYWKRNGDKISIYRPNPNAWKVYNPIKGIENHRKIQQKIGVV